MLILMTRRGLRSRLAQALTASASLVRGVSDDHEKLPAAEQAPTWIVLETAAQSIERVRDAL